MENKDVFKMANEEFSEHMKEGGEYQKNLKKLREESDKGQAATFNYIDARASTEFLIKKLDKYRDLANNRSINKEERIRLLSLFLAKLNNGIDSAVRKEHNWIEFEEGKSRLNIDQSMDLRGYIIEWIELVKNQDDKPLLLGKGSKYSDLNAIYKKVNKVYFRCSYAEFSALFSTGPFPPGVEAPRWILTKKEYGKEVPHGGALRDFLEVMGADINTSAQELSCVVDKDGLPITIPTKADKGTRFRKKFEIIVK